MKRKLLTGESFFQNTYYPEGGPGSSRSHPVRPVTLSLMN